MNCPDGWYSSRGVCMKAFENATGLTQAQVKKVCLKPVLRTVHNNLNLMDGIVKYHTHFVRAHFGLVKL